MGGVEGPVFVHLTINPEELGFVGGSSGTEEPLSVPEDSSFELLPAEAAPTPDESVANALAQAIPAIAPVQGIEPIPLGMSWWFDFQQGRMVRAGEAPIRAFGVDAVKMWAQMALRTARYAYAVFSDQFGMEDPDELIGALNVTELLADFAARAVEALLVHDRISAVEGFNPVWEPANRCVVIPLFRLVLDNQQRVALTDTRVNLAGGR
jgi:Protein of unknown function (DUF2634)